MNTKDTITIENLSYILILGDDLVQEIKRACERLEANYCVVNDAVYNDYADCELYEIGEGCIDWHYRIEVMRGRNDGNF